jgi:16S rRNA (cytidine1402-2'-O)-methyltransferase
MSDMTFRAVETLKNVDCILCEDTRTTGGLLKHYEIGNKNSEGFSKLMSFHSHSKLQKVNQIVEMIRTGKNLALVSDAGTPCILDQRIKSKLTGIIKIAWFTNIAVTGIWRAKNTVK